MEELEEMPDPGPLAAAVATLEEPLRKLGVYISASMIVPTEHGLLGTVDCLIGDAALSVRVQDPGQAASDDVLRQMQHEQQRTEFSSTKDELQRRLAEGKGMFGEDEK